MEREQDTYSDDTKRYKLLLDEKKVSEFDVTIVNGNNVTVDWLSKTGLKEPFIVIDHQKMGLKVPSSTLSTDQLIKYIGKNTPVMLIDVEKQQEVETWSFDKWARYFANPATRSKVYNSISLEFSNTHLAAKVKPPRFVRKLGWVENFWPEENSGDDYPYTQLYCLMSIEGSFTDFHIDFGGSSVWYHMLRGEKVFYLLPPTKENLLKYESWSTKAPRNTRDWFFGDHGDSCSKLRLTAGETLIIPTGWIHAVHTPVDSIAFGGNFLHGFNIPLQVQCHDIDKRTTSKKFQFPRFESATWYAAKFYFGCLAGIKNEKSRRSKLRLLYELERKGIPALLDCLRRWISNFDNTNVELRETEQKSKATAFMVSQSLGFSHPGEFVAALSEALNEESKSMKLRLKIKDIGVVSGSSDDNDTWVIRCPCGLNTTDYDDGLRMIACDSCEIWQHTACIGISDEVETPPSYICEDCKKFSKKRIKVLVREPGMVESTASTKAAEEWTVDCSCGVVALNYDDGWRMVLCSTCATWQHTECAGISGNREPPMNYLCFRCQIPKHEKSTPRSKKSSDNAWIDDGSHLNNPDDEDFRPTVKKIRVQKQKTRKKAETVRERLFRKLNKKA